MNEETERERERETKVLTKEWRQYNRKETIWMLSDWMFQHSIKALQSRAITQDKYLQPAVFISSRSAPSGLGRGPSFQTLTRIHSCNTLMTSSHLHFPLDDTLSLPSAYRYWFATLYDCYMRTVLIPYPLHSACLPILPELFVYCSTVCHHSYYIYMWWNKAERREMHTEFSQGKLREGGRLENLGTEVRIQFKWILKYIEGDGLYWIHLVEYRNRWRAFLNTVMNSRFL
jgi:hypothetical protein